MTDFTFCDTCGQIMFYERDIINDICPKCKDEDQQTEILQSSTSPVKKKMSGHESESRLGWPYNDDNIC